MKGQERLMDGVGKGQTVRRTKSEQHGWERVVLCRHGSCWLPVQMQKFGIEEMGSQAGEWGWGCVDNLSARVNSRTPHILNSISRSS